MITNGTVSIEDGVKALEEYAPARKVRVELSFDVPEGGSSEEMLNKVAAVAQVKVHELLGREPAKEVAKTEAISAETTAAPKASAKKKAAKEPAKPAEPETTKADLAKEAGLPTEDIVSKGEPASLLEDEAEDEPEDDMNDLLGESAPVPITDKELETAVQHKMATMKSKHGADWKPTVIRKIAEKYDGAPAPKRIANIPVEKRQAFLAEIEAVQ